MNVKQRLAKREHRIRPWSVLVFKENTFKLLLDVMYAVIIGGWPSLGQIILTMFILARGQGYFSLS